MTGALRWIIRGAEFVAAMMMAAMFLTFILQVTIRYTARLGWIAEAVPLLDPTRYGWTLEFCLLMWIWIVFWGNAFIVRQRDHVIFDIVYVSVSPQVRKWFAILSAVAIAAALLWAFLPTWEKFHILRLKKTATLTAVFGDWIRVRHIYLVFFLFLGVVALRYISRTIHILRHGAEADLHHYGELAEEPDRGGGA